MNSHSFSSICKSHSAATFFHPLISLWEWPKQIWQQACSFPALNHTDFLSCIQFSNLLTECHPLWGSQADTLFMSKRKQHFWPFFPLQDWQAILSCPFLIISVCQQNLPHQMFPWFCFPKSYMVCSVSVYQLASLTAPNSVYRTIIFWRVPLSLVMNSIHIPHWWLSCPASLVASHTSSYRCTSFGLLIRQQYE